MPTLSFSMTRLLLLRTNDGGTMLDQLILNLDITSWPPDANGFWITVDENAIVLLEEAVNVLQGPIGRLWVKEVCGWDE